MLPSGLRILVDVVNFFGHFIIATGDSIVEYAAHLLLAVTHLLLQVKLLLLQQLHLLGLGLILGQFLLHLLQFFGVIGL